MLKHELKNFLSGTGEAEYANFIQTSSRYLAAGKATGKKAANTKLTKQEEAERITNYISLPQQPDLRNDNNRFIAEGAEQKFT